MNEPVIQCPACKHDIKLTESLAAPLVESARKQYEEKIALKEAEVSAREAQIRDQQEALTQARETIDAQVAGKLQAERQKITVEEASKARTAFANDLEQKEKEKLELQSLLQVNNQKLAEAQKAQAEIIRKERELDDAKREMELNIEKRVGESLSAVRDSAKREAEEALKLKVSEKEQTITSMQRQIEELKRRAEQGSQQLQGEVLELEIEAMIRNQFPSDISAPVPKGEYGGDVLQTVMSPSGQNCGSILWESKRTKHWSDGWLSKLRDDQRAAKADMALIVSHSLPKGIEPFGMIDGVWVTDPKCAVPVAMAIRQSLIEIAGARKSGEGQQSKMELVYQYLTSPRFRHRIEAIVEKFTDMREDLDKERKVMTRLWAKREMQIQGVIESTAGMYGDLQGIAGKTLKEIEGLNVSIIEADYKSASAENE